MQTMLDDKFTEPDPVDAVEYCRAILGPLLIVADGDQITYARYLLDDIDTVPGRTIYPIGPSLGELQARLDAANRGTTR